MHFMRISQLLFLLFISTSGESHGENDVISIKLTKDDLKTLVEKFLDKAMKVVANNDPYQLGKLDMNYNGYGIMSKGYMENILLSFMSTTNVSNLIVDKNTSLLLFGFDVHAKQLQVTGSAKWNFDALTMFKISLAGNFGMLLKGLSIKLRTSLKETENNVLQFADFDLKVTLQDSKAEMDELNERKALGVYASKILTDMFAISLNENPQAFSVISVGLKAFLNSIFQKQTVTMDKVIDFMEHFIQ